MKDNVDLAIIFWSETDHIVDGIPNAGPAMIPKIPFNPPTMAMELGFA